MIPGRKNSRIEDVNCLTLPTLDFRGRFISCSRNYSHLILRESQVHDAARHAF